MKKSIALVLIFMLVMALLPMDLKTAGADEETTGQCGDNLYWSFDEETGTLTITGRGEMYDFADWDQVPWDQMRSSIQEVVLPEEITSIGNYTFDGCEGLTSITIPDGVITIGKQAFGNCHGLTEIVIPDSVETIGDSAFFECWNLTSITMPSSLTFLGGSAIYGCRRLTEITIPDGLTCIEGYAFRECSGLTEITIPDSVTRISVEAFMLCKKLKSVTIPNAVTIIDESAFDCCEALTDVYYLGTEAQREEIMIRTDNAALLNATWHYLPIAFKSQSLALEGQIGVYFYLDLPQDAAVTYEGVDFTIDNVDGADASVAFDPNMPTNDNGYYQFVYYVRSIEMADTITATLKYKLNGEDKTLEKTYSVKQYFAGYDANTELFSELQQAMTEATADYGHYVQAFLAAQKGWTWGTEYAEMDKHYANYTAEDISAAATGLADYVTVKDPGTNMKQINYTLVLDSDTQLLVLFTPVKGYTGTFTFTVNGDPIAEDDEKISAVRQTDGRYLMSIKNIGAHELGSVYEIKAIDDDGGESIITVSPLSYVNFIMTSYADDTAAVNAAVAIWRYATAAEAVIN